MEDSEEGGGAEEWDVKCSRDEDDAGVARHQGAAAEMGAPPPHQLGVTKAAVSVRVARVVVVEHRLRRLGGVTRQAGAPPEQREAGACPDAAVGHRNLLRHAIL
ncbi:hypothetical protein BHM03_00054782 [Ensete ventricosum]|nr:hypothetical protein BHM03_00054782 [Ensete ventricosum]